MIKYEIVKTWYDGQYNQAKVIVESEIYLHRKEAEIDRIHYQTDYEEKLEIRGLNHNE